MKTSQKTTEDSRGTELMTVSEVLAELQISRFLLYRLINSGQLPSITFGKSRRFRRVALEAYLEQLERQHVQAVG